MTVRRNILANYISQFYVLAIGILIVPFYIQYLGAEAYGLVAFYALLQMWLNLLNMGLTHTLARETARRQDPDREAQQAFQKMLNSLEFIFTAIFLVVAIGIYSFSDLISNEWLTSNELSPESVSTCIGLMGFIAGTRLFTALFHSGINGAEKQIWLSQMNVLFISLKYIGALFILHFISTDIVTYFVYQVIVHVIEFGVLKRKFYRIIGSGKFHPRFSWAALKPVFNFTKNVFLTTVFGVLLTQTDKLIMSGVLSLDKYAYFMLAALISTSLATLTGPFSRAIVPRMTALIAQHKNEQMLHIFRQSTQYSVAVIGSAVTVMVVFPHELLYVWTGDLNIANWADDILMWFAIGNGLTAIISLQYMLQLAFGELKYQVWYQSILTTLSLPVLTYVAYHFDPVWVASAWCLFRMISFIVWVPIIMSKLLPGIYLRWLFQDVLPAISGSLICVVAYFIFSPEFPETRLSILILLVAVGFVSLMLNALAAKFPRQTIAKLLRWSN